MKMMKILILLLSIVMCVSCAKVRHIQINGTNVTMNQALLGGNYWTASFYTHGEIYVSAAGDSATVIHVVRHVLLGGLNGEALP